MYEFLSGPALWITFIIFLGGLIVRLTFLFGLSKGKDRILYNHIDMGWGLKSILHWLIPLGSVSLRSQPVFSIMVFVFHFCLLALPLFLGAHNLLWDESFGVSLWSMPDIWADVMTIVFICSGVFLLLRRLMRPEVRVLTDAWDYTLLILTVLPFLTGFIAYRQLGDYETFLILHILSAEILLILIPFTKLGHMALFFFTRTFIGFEMGTRRGTRTW
ncbi:MAG: nitrate reductase [Desulfobacterales bacterium]|nr:nitrate reductase [Desulfobacterales bacterium]